MIFQVGDLKVDTDSIVDVRDQILAAARPTDDTEETTIVHLIALVGAYANACHSMGLTRELTMGILEKYWDGAEGNEIEKKKRNGLVVIK